MNRRLLWFRLPQTLVRALAIRDSEPIDFITTPFRPKYTKEDFITTSIVDKINFIIIRSSFGESSEINTIENLGNQLTDVYDELILDLNVVNNYEVAPKLKQFSGEISILDYASGSFSPKVSDLLLGPRPLLQSFGRSLHVRRKLRIDTFYDWTGGITTSCGPYLPWLWRSKELDFSRFKQGSAKLLASLAFEDQGLEKYLNSKHPILYLAGPEVADKSFHKTLETNLDRLEKYFLQVNQKAHDFEVFVKAHRSIQPHEINSRLQNYQHFKINYFNSIFSHYVPSEVMLYGGSTSYLLSILGSSIFGFPLEKTLILPSIDFRNEAKSYSIALSRTNRYGKKLNMLV